MNDFGPVARAAELLRARAGFRRDPALHGRLTRCINDAAAVAGREVDDYVATLPSDHTALQHLVDRVTIQESSFFRDDAQFLAFGNHLLAGLPTTTIWSAGCANGQEPWSLAMLLDERGRTDCSIVATDISTTAVARASRGWYSPRELRGLSPDRLERYFQACGDGFEVVPELRRLVRFAHHNLSADAAPVPPGKCAVAFCRNVLIYLTDEEITGVLDRLASTLGPGGHLFLGYSESLWRLPSRFTLRRLGGTFVYQVPNRPTAPVTSGAPQPGETLPPARTPRPEPPVTAAPALSADDYFELGQAAATARDLPAAVVAFRKAAYLRSDDARIALHLAFAMESLGDADGARPWFRRALETMVDAGPFVSVLDGWSTPELTAVIERKLSASGLDR